jgi:ABC-type multidrug transport system ATPase subunit
MSDIERLCDRVAILRGGLVAFVGPVTQLKNEFGANRPDADIDSRFEEAVEPFYAGAHQ